MKKKLLMQGKKLLMQGFLCRKKSSSAELGSMTVEQIQNP
jgi:hypothetical protein